MHGLSSRGFMSAWAFVPKPNFTQFNVLCRFVLCLIVLSQKMQRQTTSCSCLAVPCYFRARDRPCFLRVGAVSCLKLAWWCHFYVRSTKRQNFLWLHMQKRENFFYVMLGQLTSQTMQKREKLWSTFASGRIFTIYNAQVVLRYYSLCPPWKFPFSILDGFTK